ncbi:glycerol-3-phosphate acyltransferase 3 [Grus japonensis]|uniref:Glycerol-3-phosphate acyltransferase 3 n=1 Tax=Grus japonensis TaxID=30415 RepID=A0ABC9WXF2_GRUJA
MEEEIADQHRGCFSLADVMYFSKKGCEAVAEDEVTQRFSSEELVSWNLLSRTNASLHHVSWQLSVVWVMGILIRYCLLMPFRENRPQEGGICVANHTSPLDVLILASDGCYSLYDPRFGDAFWNSTKYSMMTYVFNMMTSWAIVCNVWYLPPMVKEEEEDAVHFANRVKAVIAAQGGMSVLPW